MMNNMITLLDEIEELKRENQQLKAKLTQSKDQQSYWQNTSKEAPQNDCQDKTNFYESIFEENKSVMLLIDPDTGQIVDANRAACDFYGYEKNTITNMNIDQINILPPRKINRHMGKAVEKTQIKFHFKHRLANGNIRNVEVISGPAVVNNKKYLQSIIYDVTERTNKIRLLDHSERRFKQLFNNVDDSVFFFKVDNNKALGKFQEVNHAAYSKLGYTYDEMLELSPFDIDIDLERKLPDLIREIKKNGSVTYRTIHITKDKQQIPVEVNAHLFDFLGEKSILTVARDITNRLDIENSLRESIAKHKKLMTFLPDAVIITDGRQLLFVNEYGTNLLGYRFARELIGRKFYSIIHPDYHLSVKERLKQVEEQDIAAPLVEEKYIKQDRTVVDVEVTAVKIPYDNHYAFMLVARDITQRKKVKSQLDEKIEFEKLRTEFFANISHELRTPLNVILGSLQLQSLYINSDVSNKNSQKYQQINKRMKQNCYRLLRLVNNIIDITKIDSGFYNVALQNCDVLNLIKNIVLSVEDYVKKQNLSIKLRSTVDKAVTACDPEKIERIMLNLLSNAIKFSKPQGKIEVSIDIINNEVVISVKDSGIGIPKEKLDDIFNRFSQVDKSLTRNHEGSGIGLSLVKSLVEMQGGRVCVKSQKEKGSQFTIILPVKEIEKTQPLSSSTDTLDGFNIERMHIEFSDIYRNS